MTVQGSDSICSAAHRDSRQLRYGFNFVQALLCDVSMTASSGTSLATIERTIYVLHASSQDSLESIQHVLLHCPAYEHRKAALCTAVACLPAAHAFTPVLVDAEGSRPFYEMTSWEKQRRQLLQWTYFCMVSSVTHHF